MPMSSKVSKPDNFKSQNSPSFSDTNIRVLRSSFVDCESFFESDSPDILVFMRQNLRTRLILTISL